MSDAGKILHDLQTLTRSIDLDRAELAKLTITPDVRLDMQHHIARCLHSLRELEFVLEGQSPSDPNEIDVLI